MLQFHTHYLEVFIHVVAIFSVNTYVHICVFNLTSGQLVTEVRPPQCYI